MQTRRSFLSSASALLLGKLISTSGLRTGEAGASIPFQTGPGASEDIFTDITEEAGITWKHFSGRSPDRFLIEASSGGVGFIDYDNDGLLDIYLVNGGETPRGKSPAPIRNALYRNLGNGKFEDVAEKAGVANIPFYGMGVAVADYDNDGNQDMYVTGFPSSALFHNNGDGTFTEVTEKAGVANSGKWGASAAWFDYDGDGFLDLFVCNYAKMSFADPHPCQYEGRPAYCDQKSYAPSRSKLYHNNGDGTFTDVSARSGIQECLGRAFGVVAIDANGDGRQDLFVASDATPNLLLMNRGDGTFEDQGLDAEVAFNLDGMARSGMGVDAGDVNGDGLPDFVVTNFHDEHHALYINTGKFPYDERTLQSGLARLTSPYVGWGVKFIDYDNNGTLDLLIVNGHITRTIELVRKDIHYKEPPLLLANDGKAVFHNMQDVAGPAFRRAYSGRGLAIGDIDNNGGVDAIFIRLDDSPVLLRNNIGQKKPWVGVQLQGTKSNRDAIGSKVTLDLGHRKLVRWLTGGSSFLASHDKRIVFGLGSAQPPMQTVTIEVTWPSGQKQTVAGLGTNQYHKIVESHEASK